MNIEVRYYTKSGNTKKLAEAIAAALNIEAKTVEAPLSEKVDILFLGSSVYAAGVDKSIKEFIKNNKNKIGKIVNFSTAALLSSTYKQVAKICKANNIEFASEEFHCKGSFATLHKGRPNEQDCKDAATFATNYLSAK